jgi:hypothetical protein
MADGKGKERRAGKEVCTIEYHRRDETFLDFTVLIRTPARTV